ncbi:MAG: serine esterase [Deltaproteobacteria bacterium]|nr:serine esterase [Deltaproteobacteria bacterium]
MLVLHGLGDSLEGFTWLPEYLALPRLNYLLLNAPDRYYSGFAWYDLEQPELGVVRSRGLLTTLFAELEAQGWASERILMFGFSQGCLMSLDFAMRHDQRLLGVVGVSGYVFAPEKLGAEMHPCAREQAVLVTHGTYDELLPLERTRAQMAHLRSLGVNLEWHEFPKTHTMDPEHEVPLIRNWLAGRLATLK